MSYIIKIKSEVKKYLLTFDKSFRIRISRCINELSDNPRPYGCKKLKNCDAYRIRVGDYRVVYEIDDNVLVILVIRVAYRKEVYQ